jgi:hypothetical protein
MTSTIKPMTMKQLIVLHMKSCSPQSFTQINREVQVQHILTSEESDCQCLCDIVAVACAELMRDGYFEQCCIDAFDLASFAYHLDGRHDFEVPATIHPT